MIDLEPIRVVVGLKYWLLWSFLDQMYPKLPHEWNLYA